MIKIIKQGKNRFKKECPVCGCIFSYEKEDICNCTISESDNGITVKNYTHIKYVKCPQCGEQLEFSKDKNDNVYERLLYKWN